YVARAADILLRRDRGAWDTLIDHIVSMSLAELPWATLEYAASRLDTLTEKQSSALASQMNTLVDTDSVDAEAAKNYQNLVFAIPSSHWSTGPLQAHAKKLRARLLALFNQPEYLSTYFPAARDLLSHAPNGEGAAFLKQLFEQAAGAPPAYPILHREMVGFWPEEDEQTGQYGPTNIAQRSIQFIRENPAVEGTGHVLESVVDLVDSGLAESSVRPDVSNVVAVLWPHAPGFIVACLEKIAGYISPSDVKTLVLGNQPKEAKVGDLQAVLSAVADANDEGRCTAIAKEILASAPKQIDDEPDGALSLWCSSLSSKETGVLKALIHDDGLNDDQRERVLRYAITHSDALGLEFFTESLPATLAKPEEPKSVSAIVAKMDDIARLASSRDQKNALVSSLIPSMPDLPREALSVIARVVHRAGGKGALERSSEILEKLDTDQLQIVSEEFPDSKILARYTTDSEGKAAE
ncbi:MAG: hypothetical protein KDD77_14520, partial [Caldilineaceae bacterium]|nr:hypothetical protein [Caldilineaceae bacterium]